LYLEFSRAFKDADEVIVTEVYAAREPVQEFTSAEIVSGMPHRSVRFISGLAQVTNHLLIHLRPEDVLVVLSAGDADRICTDLLKAFKER
jgi:UDP-N-acetylmuramate--alanine ligase